MKSPTQFELTPDEQAEEKVFDAPDAVKPKLVKPRDAATLILVRGGREVMMGQRSKGHVFMPDKWVFPGGRVDPHDARAKATTELTPETEALLKLGGVIRRPPRAFALAATRETLEETGLILGGPEGPELDRLQFVARAITPPYRPRRFDARFFMAEADSLLSLERRPDCGELDEIEWVDLDEALALDLPNITRFVVAEIAERLAKGARPIPFMRFLNGARRLEHL